MSPVVAFAIGTVWGAVLTLALSLAATSARPVPTITPTEPEGEGPLHDRLDSTWFVMSESAITDVADAAFGEGFRAGRADALSEWAS